MGLIAWLAGVVWWVVLLIAAVLLALLLLFCLLGLLQLVWIGSRLILFDRWYRKTEWALRELQEQLWLVDAERERLAARGEFCSEKLIGRRKAIAQEIQRLGRRLGLPRSEIRKLISAGY